MYRKSLSYLKILVCAAFMMVTVSAVSPSAEAAVYTGSGDGMILIDGVPASDFSHLYDDSRLFQAVVVQELTDDESGGFHGFHHYLLQLYLSPEPFTVNSDNDLVIPSGSSRYIWVSSTDIASLTGLPFQEWTLLESNIGGVSFVHASLLYSNANVAGYPFSNNYLDNIISLDGYEYIWWDGLVDSLSPYEEYYYNVSSSMDVPVEAFSVTTQTLFNVFVCNDSRVFSNALSSDDYGWYLDNIDSFSASYSVLNDSSNGNLYFSCGPDYGLYDFYTYFLAYSYSPVVDFSNTELTISNPDYDFRSASFDVSWSGLPEIPYPENIQYYLTAKLNDGSSATHPYTYIGSSSDPPSGDVPVSFTFDDLQPSTEYTATVELRYSYGGNTSFDSTVSSGVTASVSFTTLSDGSISEGDKAIIDAIQNTNQQHEQWIDSELGSAVGDLNEDVAAAEQQINDLNNQEEAFKDDAFARFQEVSASFSGFDGTVGSGIGLAGTLFSRFFNCLGDYAIIYTFPLILGLAMVIIGRLSRSSFSLEDKDHDQFTIDGW